VFALDDDTAAFWQALGFTCFHEGQRSNPRSGRTSAAVETRGPLHRLWWSVCDEPVPFIEGSPNCPGIESSMSPRQRDRAIVDWAQKHVIRP